MKTRLFTALGALTLLTASAAVAQNRAPMKADIPFGFRAGTNVLPPGEYEIRPDFMPNVITVKHVASGKTAAIIAGPTYPAQVPEKGLLVFNRYGNSHYLSKVLTPGMSVGRQLTKSKAELESASNAASAPVTVAVR